MKRTLPVLYVALNLGCALLVLSAANRVGAVALWAAVALGGRLA